MVLGWFRTVGGSFVIDVDGTCKGWCDAAKNTGFVRITGFGFAASS